MNRIPIYISPVKPNKKTCQCYLWGVWLHQCQSINYEDYRYNHQSHHHNKTQQSTNRIHDSWKLLMSIALSLSLLLNWYHWREWPYIYTVFHLYQFWLHLIQVVHMTLQMDQEVNPSMHYHKYLSYEMNVRTSFLEIVHSSFEIDVKLFTNIRLIIVYLIWGWWFYESRYWRHQGIICRCINYLNWS